MKDSILLTKSKAFALRVVRLYKYLRERKESVIAKQMDSLLADCIELVKLLTSSIKTAKTNA